MTLVSIEGAVKQLVRGGYWEGVGGNTIDSNDDVMKSLSSVVQGMKESLVSPVL